MYFVANLLRSAVERQRETDAANMKVFIENYALEHAEENDDDIPSSQSQMKRRSVSCWTCEICLARSVDILHCRRCQKHVCADCREAIWCKACIT